MRSENIVQELNKLCTMMQMQAESRHLKIKLHLMVAQP